MPQVSGRCLRSASQAAAALLALPQDAGSCATAWFQPHGGAPSQRGVKIPPGTSRENLGVRPFPGSTHPISLPLLSSCSSAAREQPGLRNTLWLCRKSRVPTGCLSQEVRAANEEARCRGFSPCFGAARLPQETWVPEQPVRRLPLAAQVWIWSQKAGGLLPACSPLAGGGGGSHLSSGAALAGRMRMESRGAEVPKSAQSFSPSSWPPGMARCQPGEGAGGHAAGHVLVPPWESSLSIRLSVSRPASPPQPGAARIQR